MIIIIGGIIILSIYPFFRFTKVYTERRWKEDEQARKNFPSEEALQKHARKVLKILSIILVVLTVIVGILVYYKIRKADWNYAKLLFVLSYCSGIILMMVNLVFEDRFFPNYSNFTIFFILVSMFLIVKTSIDINYVEHGRYTNTVITTKDSSYISNETSYFIGKTEKFVFVYNKKDSTNTIIPMEKVEKIMIRERGYSNY